MKIIKALILGISISYCTTALAQTENTFVKLRHGLPNVLKVTNVRVYSDSPTSARISIWIDVRNGKIVSVSRGQGDWIITIRSRGQVSTYVVSEKSFKVVGEESKAVQIRALHFTEG